MQPSEPHVATVVSPTKTSALMPPPVWQSLAWLVTFLFSRSQTLIVESTPPLASTPALLQATHVMRAAW